MNPAKPKSHSSWGSRRSCADCRFHGLKPYGAQSHIRAHVTQGISRSLRFLKTSAGQAHSAARRERRQSLLDQLSNRTADCSHTQAP